MWKRLWLLAGLSCGTFVGCATLPVSESLTPQESTAVVETARQKLIAAYPKLDGEATAAIAREPANFSYYRMAGNYFQYFLVWEVSSNRFATVYGQGNIRELENARVILKTVPTPGGNDADKP